VGDDQRPTEGDSRLQGTREPLHQATSAPCCDTASNNARTDDNADAKMILTALPPDNWKRPPGRPRITWLNTVQRDLRAYNLTLNEAVDLAQNRPLCRLMSTYEEECYQQQVCQVTV